MKFDDLSHQLSFDFDLEGKLRNFQESRRGKQQLMATTAPLDWLDCYEHPREIGMNLREEAEAKVKHLPYKNCVLPECGQIVIDVLRKDGKKPGRHVALHVKFYSGRHVIVDPTIDQYEFEAKWHKEPPSPAPRLTVESFSGASLGAVYGMWKDMLLMKPMVGKVFDYAWMERVKSLNSLNREKL